MSATDRAAGKPLSDGAQWGKAPSHEAQSHQSHEAQSHEAQWGKAQWQALGTLARLVVTEPDRLEVARAAVIRELADVDAAASRFRDDSELAAVNRAGGAVIGISATLTTYLAAAVDAAADTGGAVDPTLGSILVRLGYDRTFADVETDAGPVPLTVRRRTSWRDIGLDRVAHTVQLPAGMTLDLGCTAKALASDRAAAAAADAAGCGVLVSLGGDIAIAGEPPATGWPVLVGDSSLAELWPPYDGQVVRLRGGGLATSSSTVRRWQRGGMALHHLLDPWSGLPAAGPWRTVSVAATSCLQANIASTAALVLGRAGRTWLVEHALPGRLTEHAGAVQYVGGWRPS